MFGSVGVRDPPRNADAYALFSRRGEATTGGGETPLAEDATLFGQVGEESGKSRGRGTPFALGRRNWLFFDQSTGAEASTSFYTIIETAKANGIEPMHYLRFLFSCIEHFGSDRMPWQDLLPTPEIRAFSESLGIPYSMGL